MVLASKVCCADDDDDEGNSAMSTPSSDLTVAVAAPGYWLLLPDDPLLNLESRLANGPEDPARGINLLERSAKKNGP